MKVIKRTHAHFFSKGKVIELIEKIEKEKPDVLFVNNRLSSLQTHKLKQDL